MAATLLLGLGLASAACNPDPYPGEKGEILHVGLRLLPKTFDPPDIGEEGSNKVSAHVYDGLLAYHPYARPYKLVPALADGMPEVSEDKLTFTFRIKRGVYFHDDPSFVETGGVGREVSAHDFLYAFKRFSHPDVHAKGWWLFDGRIEGLNEWRDARAAEADAKRAAGDEVPYLHGLDVPVEGFQVLDDYTLQIKLTEPYPQLLWVLAMPYASVYPHEAVEHYGDEYRNNPVGTGPFEVVEYNPVYRVVYKRFERYRDETVPDPRNNPADRVEGWDWEADEAAGYLVDAGEKVPQLDGMEIRFLLEDQPRWLYFKAGHLDFMNPPKDNSDEAITGGELTPEMKARGIRFEPWTELGTVYSALNCIDPVMGNVELRRAMALAFDHSWTIEHLYAGSAVLATSLIPPGIAGHDPSYHPFHNADGSARIELAKEHMVKAGYPGGVDPETGMQLRIRFENSGTSVSARHFAQRFTDEMRRIGIEVDVIVNTFPQMTEKMRKGDFQVAGLAWGFDYPDAQNILQLLYGPNKAPAINYVSFQNDAFDRLYEQAATMEDGPERTELYKQMAHIVGDEVPWITRVHRIRQNLQQPWLRGFKYTETSDHYWRYVSIDKEQRDQLRAEWNQPTRWPLAVFFGFFGVLVVGTAAKGRTWS